jgi:hypothetical protein
MEVMMMEAEVEVEQEPYMTDSELASVLMQEIGQGIGGTQGSDSEEVSLALDYYYGRKPGIAPARAKDPNASRIVSRDVQDALKTRTPAASSAVTCRTPWRPRWRRSCRRSRRI